MKKNPYFENIINNYSDANIVLEMASVDHYYEGILREKLFKFSEINSQANFCLGFDLDINAFISFLQKNANENFLNEIAVLDDINLLNTTSLEGEGICITDRYITEHAAAFRIYKETLTQISSYINIPSNTEPNNTQNDILPDTTPINIDYSSQSGKLLKDLLDNTPQYSDFGVLIVFTVVLTVGIIIWYLKKITINDPSNTSVSLKADELY